MRKLTLLIAALAMASITAWTLEAPARVTLTTTTPQSASTPIEELQRQIDARSLPVLEVKEPF